MEVEKFFGCYLLYSLNEKFKGRTYIGFTVDPNRRIKQHNKGLKAGGAWKTNNKGPWDMILIVHGFPTDVAALRFEWAWQNPLKSRRLRHVGKKIPRESALKYRFRVMSEMLRVGPWNRLPLTVQWLNISYKQDFDVSKLPPLHIPICVGPIVPQKVKSVEEETEVLNFCFLCHQIVTKEKRFICFNKDCKEAFHVICLGKTFVLSQPEKNKFLLPVDGNCPNCNAATLWGDVIRYVSGCYQDPQDIAIKEASPKVNSNTISVEKLEKIKNELHKVPESESNSKEPQTKLETKTDYERLLALNDSHLIQNVEQFECPVCFIDFDVGEGVTLQECLHSFCRLCLASTIEFSETVVVKCPFRNEEYTCESYLQEREVKSLVTPEVYEKHLQRSVTLAESQAQNSFHCKTPDCPGWCLFEDSVIVFLCPVCKHNNCITCAAIHEGKNCRQYQDDVAFYSDSREEARKTREHLQKLLDKGEAMRCPHCQIILIKNGGCDSLWCSMCRTSIRWIGKGSVQERLDALIRSRTSSTSSNLFGFASSLTQSTSKLFRGSTSFGVPRLTFGGFESTKTGTGLFGQSRRTRTGLFGSTAPTTEIDLPLLSSRKVGSIDSSFVKHINSLDLPPNIIPSTSVGSSEHFGFRTGPPSRDSVRLRDRNNTNHKKAPSAPRWLQDISSPLDTNFSPGLPVPTADINLPLLSSGSVGSNVPQYVNYTSSQNLSRNIIPLTSVRKNVGIGLSIDLPTQDPIVLRNRNNSNRKKRAAVIQRFQGEPSFDESHSHYLRYDHFLEKNGNIERKNIQKRHLPKDETASTNNIEKKATVKRRKKLHEKYVMEEKIAARNTNLPLLSSGSVVSKISPYAKYTSSLDVSHSIIPSTSMGSDESIGLGVGLPDKDPIELRDRDNTNCKKRATVIQRFQEISAPHDLNFTPELLSEPSFDESHSHYIPYDHFLEKRDNIKQKSVQKRRITKDKINAVMDKIEKWTSVKRRKKLHERYVMEEKFSVKSEARFEENNPYYVPNVAFKLLEKSVTAYGKSTNRLGETHLIKEETAVKSEPSLDESNHDVPKLSNIDFLEKSATIRGKNIKSLEERPLIKIETIVKSEPEFDDYQAEPLLKK